MIGECAQTCDFVHKYAGLMSDAPHLAFELTLEVLTAIPLYFIGKWRVNRRIRSEHLALDAEHGVTHARQEKPMYSNLEV